MAKAFGYFQLAALALFLTVFFGRSLYLRLFQGVNPFALGVGTKGFRRVGEILSVVADVLWITEVALYSLRAGFRIFPGPFAVVVVDWFPAKVVGVVLVTIGFVFFIWAFISFRTSWRIGVDERAPGDLVTTGIFAFSRNPVFVFFNLYYLGTFLINGTVIFLLFALATAAGLHYQILREEEFLANNYGDAYNTYRRKVRRYFGRRRSS